jgi:PhnB protein
MKTVTPYLMFNGTCREAMTFYKECLGAELHLMPFVDDKGQPLQDPSARIMHAQITVGGRSILQASDVRPEDNLTSGNNFQVSIDCESVEEIDRLFGAFRDGAKIRLPLGTMFWGARFGMLTDRFGTLWMFNCFLKQ